MQLIQNNFALKLLAVALAIAGWAYFHYAGNPILPTAPPDQQLSVPIVAANLPLGYVASFTEHEAVVTVATKRGQPAIKPDEIKAVLDLSNKGAGIYNVPVQLVAPDAAVQSLSPASVTLTIERMDERTFSIAVHYVGTLPRGIVVSGTRVRPLTATVRARTSALAQVAAINADVALPNEPKAIDEMVRPVAVDASGAAVSGMSLTPDLVRIQLRLVAGGAK